MALNEKTVYSALEILEDGQIQVRRTRRVYDDLVFIAEQHFRYVLNPGQDVAAQPLKIRQICNLIWTPQVIADWNAAHPLP